MKPILSILIRAGISANQLTLFTCIFTIIFAALLAFSPFTTVLLFSFPLVMLIRMALNALDGMLATQTNTQSALGAVLNELCDVISDAALFSAFLYLLAVNGSSIITFWWLLTVLALLTEFVSLAVYQSKIHETKVHETNQLRSHSGPFGKSDRAVYLSLLAVLLGWFPLVLNETPLWLKAYTVLGLLLASITIWQRFKSLQDVAE